MVKFNLEEELKYFTPFTMYMEYILLNYNNFLKNHLKNKNITTKEFLYLFNIFYNKNVSQKYLADLMYVSEANVAKMLKKLESKGLVERRRDKNNKSKNVLSLTKDGELTVFSLLKFSIEWETRVSDMIDEEKLVDFKDRLYEISEKSVEIK
ncbi:MAG: MarR family transcriptional regulator [Methanosphaera sp.]|nr:MarR family transcriptional regulator [Methanosphaera sp.]